MPRFEPQDPDYRRRVEESFARQAFLASIGAGMTGLEPGRCELCLPSRPDLCQQHGYLHAGVTTTLADTAAGYAAYSLMPAGSSVLTVELKINLMNPAKGERLLARAEVLKPGRTVTVTRADVFALESGRETLVASMLATMMCLHGKPDA